MDTRSPEELRNQALAVFDKQVIRLEDTARELVKILARAIEGLKEDLFGGMGYKFKAFSDVQVRRLKEISQAFNSASDAQVRLDKTAHMRAKELTVEEKKAYTADYILTLPPRERADWIREIIRRHDELKRLTTTGNKMMDQPRVQTILEDLAEPEPDDE